MTVITPTFNFGTIGLFALLTQSERFNIEKHENYQKRSERNKFDIINHLGKQTLSIPLKKGKNSGTLITEVKIAYEEDWQNYHLKCIQAAYKKAPYYDYYIDDLIKVYDKRYELLWDFNLLCIELVKKIIHLHKEIALSSDYRSNYEPDVLDMRIGKTIPLSVFNTYNQVFEDRLPFTPNVSILDLIFCLGPESKNYLNQIDLTMLFSS